MSDAWMLMQLESSLTKSQLIRLTVYFIYFIFFSFLGYHVMMNKVVYTRWITKNPKFSALEKDTYCKYRQNCFGN